MGAAVGEMVYVPYGGKLQEGKVVKHVTLDSGEKAITVRFSVAGRVAKEESFPPAAVQSQNASEQRMARIRAGGSAGTRSSGKRMLKLVLPDGLRWQLVNDWEQVCKTKLPVPLPRRPAVMDILYNFREATRDARGYTRNELVISLQEYFDDALPGLLLYAGEEELYRNAKFDRNKSPSAIYGAEHLLRLLVKLPELLSATDVLEGKIHRIQTQVNDLVMFLDANHAAFFLTRYGVPYD
mmetsp:Transcript_29166/g.52147  ORF Transcript_29166/g.52147 Transcript_29166/m.52147 type:complete len:239 (-) Transcript_29166:112-828(-)|eukprot:CAMPEP_0177770496 /NCGR_PEP_ID=MMETSP0491_2-20121128/10964_1 /TAXON_ID=63592 /ORGANISM="Tetraselmis chuii, Strain PLY429" /LENGTH=238 /DNA_ID=CAMNT_0019287731 /DNA_START=312 /DNA_END=1028 /DNA_ORIENTATION=-